MPIALPSSSRKNYLSGMDWIMQTLDDASRKKLGCGNAFQIVMELKGAFQQERFEEEWERYLENFPHLHGKLARDYNLAPYWKTVKQPSGVFLKPSFHTASGLDEAFRIMEDGLNISVEEDSYPVRTRIVHAGSHWLLGFSFDHRFFDARGAEVFLKGFQSFCGGHEVETAGGVVHPAYLNQWNEQFSAGKQINRLKIKHELSLNTVSFDTSLISKKISNRFILRTFNENETQSIYRRVEEKYGPFMFLPYSLAVTLRAMEAIVKSKKREGVDFVVPVTRDMRGSCGRTDDPFSNHLSFLFFRVKRQETQDLETLVKTLSMDFYEQVKDRVPEALWTASMLMRIVPRFFMRRGLLNGGQKELFSFSFASLGQNAFADDFFMGSEVQNIFHMPRVPPSPGIGVFFSQYKNRLNLVLSYLEGLLTEEEAGRLADETARL